MTDPVPALPTLLCTQSTQRCLRISPDEEEEEPLGSRPDAASDPGVLEALVNLVALDGVAGALDLDAATRQSEAATAARAPSSPVIPAKTQPGAVSCKCWIARDAINMTAMM